VYRRLIRNRSRCPLGEYSSARLSPFSPHDFSEIDNISIYQQFKLRFSRSTFLESKSIRYRSTARLSLARNSHSLGLVEVFSARLKSMVHSYREENDARSSVKKKRCEDRVDSFRAACFMRYGPLFVSRYSSRS
jgi:hypothetical protein